MNMVSHDFFCLRWCKLMIMPFGAYEGVHFDWKAKLDLYKYVWKFVDSFKVYHLYWSQHLTKEGSGRRTNMRLRIHI